MPTMHGPAGLGLLELKVTGDEFIMLQNNTAAIINDLSSYWLTAYNNVNPLTAGVSSSTQQLPLASLQSGQTLLLSANPMQTCGASVAGKLSLSLSDSGGFLQLSQTGLNQSGAITQTAGDMVNWSSGAAGIIQNIPSNTKDAKAAFYRTLTGNSYTWQLADIDATNGCQLNVLVAGGLESSSAVTPLTLAATSPPATILGTVSADSNGVAASLPTADIGLTAPQLSEILPNPTGTGNDNSEEFIELYNPNSKPFDLTGFSLQTGLTTTHEYVFPSGSSLAPNSFHAFYSAETKLTLSNTSGQAALLDPFGTPIGSTEVYGTAKDGLSWALAKGKWYWTTQATPNLANVIKQPATKASKAAKAKSKKAAATKRIVSKTGSGQLASTTTSTDRTEATSPIHMWVLALIAAAALLYGAYEYRRDITNRLFQFRANLRARRAARRTIAGQGSD